MGTLSSVQTVLIELRKWLFDGAHSARQPVLVFHAQNQKLGGKGAVDSMSIVFNHRLTLQTAVSSKKSHRYYVHVTEKYSLRKL